MSKKREKHGKHEKISFPDEGEFFPAKNKRHTPIVFFVHFYRGHKKALRRHVQMVNEMGFDAYAFNLRDQAKQHYMVPYSHRSKKFGMKHAIADQIEDHLDLLKNSRNEKADFEIVVFAFSNVSACAIEVMARRPDLPFKALICDSGPTLNFLDSAFKLYDRPLPLLMAPLFAVAWSPEMHKDIPADLKKLPAHFPILSIRGWKDKLVSTAGIDKVFESCPGLNWQKLSLPEAGHLTGLRDFPDEYIPAVKDFLLPVDL